MPALAAAHPRLGVRRPAWERAHGYSPAVGSVARGAASLLECKFMQFGRVAVLVVGSFLGGTGLLPAERPAANRIVLVDRVDARVGEADRAVRDTGRGAGERGLVSINE